MVLAVEAGHRLDKKGVTKWLFWTVIGGAIFVGSQGWEWAHFIHGSHFGTVLTESGGWAQVMGLEYMNGAVSEVNLMMLDQNYIMITGQDAIDMYNANLGTVQGANLLMSEYSPNTPQYADFFFFITGFHGFHVFSGVVINLLVLLRVRSGRYDSRGHFEMVEKVGLYWHFVDLVWVFVFTFFYLI
jgi:cytochrome c oxidase subunit 3